MPIPGVCVGPASTIARRLLLLPAFVPRIRFLTKPLNAAKYGISIPKGLTKRDVPTPKYVSDTEMQHLGNASGGRSLGSTGAKVKADFKLEFSDVSKQWPTGTDGKRRGRQFAGGVVYLDVTIGLYMRSSHRPKDDNRDSVDLFRLIMDHELVHVADDIDIVSNWLPPRLSQDPQIRSKLFRRTRLGDKSFNHWITKGRLSDWVRDGPWTTERNRRAALSDSPQEYKRLDQEISAIRSRHVRPKASRSRRRPQSHKH